MKWTDDAYPCDLVFEGRRYHHVTGCLASLRHAAVGNAEFAAAVAAEPSASIAAEMGDPGRVSWADMEQGKRASAPDAVDAFDRRLADGLRAAVLHAKLAPGTRLGRRVRVVPPTPPADDPVLAGVLRDIAAGGGVTRDTTPRNRCPTADGRAPDGARSRPCPSAPPGRR